MPPKRSHDNVDVEDEGDRSDEPEMKTIRIVTSEKEEKFMCELCSTILKSAAALVRHKIFWLLHSI